MHATSSQSMADHRTAAKAALAAIIFSAGVAFGAIVGTSAASVAAPESVSRIGPDVYASWLRQHREREGGDAANREVRDLDPRHPGDGGP